MRTLLFALLIATLGAFAQSASNKFIFDQQNQHKWLQQYQGFLAIPNVLGDSLNMVRNADYILKMMADLGITGELLPSGAPRSAPAVFGEVKVPGATTTLAFYAHYDGQPVNPKQWGPGIEPFAPVLFTDRLDKGGIKIPFPGPETNIQPQWRLFGRGSSDDKAGVFAILKAYETLLKTGQKPKVNLKFFFEGEEEAGSINLGTIFNKYKQKLAADLWIISDGPRHFSGKKQVVFGVRGDVNVDLTIYGAKRPLHSGNYGNWAPNPAMRLAQLLASMKDANGKVLIDGFYEDVRPLSITEKAALDKMPPVEAILMEDLALGKPDGAGQSYTDLLMQPTLNINGISAANTGAMASNIIPSEATVVLDLRLVAGNDVTRQVEKVRSHIQKMGYTIIDHDPSDEERKKFPLLAKMTQRKGGYNAQRTPMDHPLAAKVVSAVQSTATYEVVKVPTLGGSLPLYLFEQTLGTMPVTVTIVNFDNNQHAENENVMLQYLWEGIETMASIMVTK